jgi:hypothetical protein
MNPTSTSTSAESALAGLLADSWAAARAEADSDLATIPAQLAELGRRFVALDRRLLAASRRRDDPADAAAAARRAAAELAGLLALAGVASVTADAARRTLVVETAPLQLAWNGRHFDLGRFRLLLDLAGDVHVESLDRLGPRHGWDHPHIQDGLPCLGNLREGILKLIAEDDLALAVQVLLDFLTTYNPETAYTPVEGWPELR